MKRLSTFFIGMLILGLLLCGCGKSQKDTVEDNVIESPDGEIALENTDTDAVATDDTEYDYSEVNIEEDVFLNMGQYLDMPNSEANEDTYTYDSEMEIMPIGTYAIDGHEGDLSASLFINSGKCEIVNWECKSDAEVVFEKCKAALTQLYGDCPEINEDNTVFTWTGIGNENHSITLWYTPNSNEDKLAITMECHVEHEIERADEEETER